MSLADSTTDGPVPFAHQFARLTTRWNALERGWQAVVLGLVVTAYATVGTQIPW